MNIDQMLNYITIAGWIVYAVFAIVVFVRAALQNGFETATESLFSFQMLLLLFVVISISILSASLVLVAPQEVGVVISIFAPGGVRDEAMQPGLRWIIPLTETPVMYPIYWQTYTMSGKPLEGQTVGNDSIIARTEDGQEISIACSIIFRIDPGQAVQIHVDWQDRYIEDLIRPMMRGIIRTEVSQFSVDEVNSSNRKDLEMKLNTLLKQVLEDKGLQVDAFLLRNITFSSEYAASVENKQVALELATQRQHEADQIRHLAAGEADRIRVQAKAQAEALELISDVLVQNPDLLTYQYINKLSPGIRVMLLPSDAPFILSLPTMEPAETSTLTGTLPITTGVTIPQE